MIGMGESDKLHPSGPDRYNYAEQRDYLFALWDALDLGDNVTLVLHDWGSVLGFDWANQHRDRIQGIAFMEASVTPPVLLMLLGCLFAANVVPGKLKCRRKPHIAFS